MNFNDIFNTLFFIDQLEQLIPINNMKVSVYNHNTLSYPSNTLTNNNLSNITSIQTIKTKFKLKHLNQLIQSKSKQPKDTNKNKNNYKFPHQIYKNTIQTTQIYLKTQTQNSIDFFKNLQTSKNRLGISIKSKQKTTPFLQTKESGRTITSSTKKQKLSLISKFQSHKITPFQQSLETKQLTTKQQIKCFQAAQNKQNLLINSNLQKQIPIQQLNLNQLKQSINHNEPVYNKRPLKTTRQIIESKIERQKSKRKIKINKKHYNFKTQRIRV